MSLRIVVIFIAVLAGQNSIALAEVLTECGASEGYSYFFEGGNVSKGKGGWNRDKISEGRITLVVRDGKPEILIRDSMGLRDLKGEGVQFQWGGGAKESGIVVVLALAEGSVEHYAFRLDAQGDGELLWGTVRYGAGGGPYAIYKSSLMQSVCRSSRSP